MTQSRPVNASGVMKAMVGGALGIGWGLGVMYTLPAPTSGFVALAPLPVVAIGMIAWQARKIRRLERSA